MPCTTQKWAKRQPPMEEINATNEKYTMASNNEINEGDGRNCPYATFAFQCLRLPFWSMSRNATDVSRLFLPIFALATVGSLKH